MLNFFGLSAGEAIFPGNIYERFTKKALDKYRTKFKIVQNYEYNLLSAK